VVALAGQAGEHGKPTRTGLPIEDAAAHNRAVYAALDAQLNGVSAATIVVCLHAN